MKKWCIDLKIVQTSLNEIEYQLLKQLSKKRKKSIKELVREAIRKLIEEEVNPNDPIFTEPPLVDDKKKIEKTSEEHDRVLYSE